jgi:hypothetical protein
MLESIANMIAGPLAAQISKRTGLPEGVVKTAVVAAVPMLIGALAKNATTDDGARSLHDALERDHDGSVLDDVDGYVDRGGDIADGNAILGHALGGTRPDAERAIAETSGLDPNQVDQLLPMVAPLVMGALGKEQRSRHLDPSGLADLVSAEQREAVERDEGGLGGMAVLLDRDGDGDVMDDVGDLAGLAAKFLGR